MGSVCLLSSIARRFRGRKIVSAQREIVFISTNDCGVALGSCKHSEHTSSLTYSCDGKVGQCMTALVMSKTRTSRAEGIFTGFWSLGAPDIFFLSFQTKPSRGGLLCPMYWYWDQNRGMFCCCSRMQITHIWYICLTGSKSWQNNLFKEVFWRAGPEFIV